LIIDSSHKSWIAGTAVLTALATASYVVYAAKSPDGPTGGSLAGMLYGIGGSLLMLFAGLLSPRKQVPTWRLGRAQTWLKGHIWLGLLSVPLILFHSGFHWGGRLEQVLWIVFALIIASGILGLVLQQVLPRFMTKQVSLETIYEQIPHVCSVMRTDADAIVTAVCGPLGIEPPAETVEEKGKKKAKPVQPMEGSGPLKDFYLRDVRPFSMARTSGPRLSRAKRERRGCIARCGSCCRRRCTKRWTSSPRSARNGASSPCNPGCTTGSTVGYSFTSRFRWPCSCSLSRMRSWRCGIEI
jgi:hypothetical protein